MEFNNVENRCHNTVDGSEVWDSRSVAVVGMILMRHEGEIYTILGKRGTACPNEVGKWCMPCGFLDKNETCEEGVVREIWEESGFNCIEAISKYEVLHDQMNFPWKINSTPDTDIQNVSMHYALFLKSGEEGLPELTIEHNAIEEEVSEVKWVNTNDLGLYDIAFNHESTIRVFVANLDSELK